MCPRGEGRASGSNDLSVNCPGYILVYGRLTPVSSVGHHSTSDDSFAYRPRQEVEDRKKVDNPIVRFRLFMESKGWWSKEEDDVTKERLKHEVMTTFKRVEKLKRHELKELFEDVYGGDEPWNLVSSSCPPFLLYPNNSQRLHNGKSYPGSCESTAPTGSRGSRSWTSSGEKGKNLSISEVWTVAFGIKISSRICISIQHISLFTYRALSTPSCGRCNGHQHSSCEI